MLLPTASASLQPGLAHNIHMPSHIDIRRGRWQQALDGNLKAVEADRQYRQIAGPPKGFLPVYVAHNRAHARLRRNDDWSERTRHQAYPCTWSQSFPRVFSRNTRMVAEGFAAMPLEVLVRFGRWDDILAEPATNYHRLHAIFASIPPCGSRDRLRGEGRCGCG